MGSDTSPPKRVYDSAKVQRAEEGFAVLLDAKPVRTPAGATLVLPTQALAQAVAAEWRKQGDKIDPTTMPMTQHANTALDGVRGREDKVVKDIVAYARSDLLCYRADSPQGLVAMQKRRWDPVLAWAEQDLGALFKVQAGISHMSQPAQSLDRIRNVVADYDFFSLTPLHVITTLTGSALLALANACGYLGANDIWAAAHVDEDWQISQWGEDAEATARRAARKAEFDAASRFLGLVRS